MPRSGVPVKTGNEKSVIPTHTNNFLAECVDLYSTATSVLCDAVPVPKESVPHPLHSSIDPVFPAVEADSPAAAESPPPEYPADGDQTLLTFFPLTTVESQGLATIFLRPSGPDNQYFSATGQLLEVTYTTRHYIRAIYLLDRYSLFRLNAHLWTLLSAAFDLSAFTALCLTFSAAHAYKFLPILLYNWTHYARVSITYAIQMLPTNPCSNGEELVALHSSVVAYSVLHNVLNGKFAFDPVAEILHQVTYGLQRATSTLPSHLQTDFRKAARVLNSRFSRALGVHPTAFLLRIAPTLQPPLEPITSAPPGPTTFVALMAGTTPDAATASSVFTSSAPSAFLARRGSAPISDRERYDRSRLLALAPVTVRVLRTIVHLRPTARPTRSDWSASRLSSRSSELIAAAVATASTMLRSAPLIPPTTTTALHFPLRTAPNSRRPPMIKMKVHCATTLRTSVALQRASKPTRGRPPDWIGSEEGRPSRTSIPARLAVRRGDRATA